MKLKKINIINQEEYKMTNLEIIRQACIKANPEIIISKNYERTIREIRLADVLLAIEKKELGKEMCIGSDGQLAYRNNHFTLTFLNHYWDLKNDNLELQPEETLEFLSKLLTPIKQ